MDKSNIIEEVVKTCHKRLLKDAEVLDYLCNQRQLSRKTLQHFQVGLFPQNIHELFNVVEPKLLREAEIIHNASRSRFQTWDIIMPIRDVYGKYVAIAGRTRLNEEDRKKKNLVKYMNSAYHKSHHLFGLNLAKKSILNDNAVYVVEGYFDVMMPHQYGMNNVVAVCGAYLSTKHIALLARYTDRIVLLFDNEDIARERANRIINKKQFNNVKIETINPFPDNIKDIDEYLKHYDVDSLLSKIKGRDYGDIEPIWD